MNEQFETMTLGYADQMFRLAYARVGNATDAEDIVQETYLKAFRSFHMFSHQTNVRHWLTQIVINTARDHFRKSARMAPTVDIGDALEEIAGAVSVPGPEDQLCNSEIDPALQQALASIPEQFLTPFLLREIHHASYEEIAAILQIPKGTVMSRLFRARSLLRKRLLAHSCNDA